MPIALEPFNPSRNFVAKIDFRAGGVVHPKGHPFRKHFVNERVLRQLYEARKIGYGDASPLTEKERKRASKRMNGLLASFAASVLAHARWDHRDKTAEAAAAGGTAPAKAEAAAAPEGAATAAATSADRDAKIEKLVIENSHGKLLELANGLGMTKRNSKAEIATAIVDAGRTA